MIEFLLEIKLNGKISGLLELFIKKPVIELHYNNDHYEFIAWGDPISSNDFRERFEKNSSPEFIVNNLYGHYYFTYLNKKSGDLLIGNSLFSILPLYYQNNFDKITISENALTLGRYTGSNKICNRFLLETILFNYPLFNSSILQDINLLPSNSCLLVKQGKLLIKKHNFIENFFDKKTVPWRKSIGIMSDKFLETVEKYLPSKHYSNALTGGFDGRTLVSAGLFYNKDFSTYSFGAETSKDVVIAEALSAKADLNFNKIGLGQEYATQKSLECGREFIMNSSGTATFARAHYLFAAKQLSKNNNQIITGNFGSEIFRAAHIAGVVISGNLFTLFNSDSPQKAFRSVEASAEFCCLNRAAFKEEWEWLKENILQLPSYNKHYSDFTKNQRFYVFVFEELFRKYFGAEMVNQFRYLKNRTPYLDIDFLKAIFKTELAGIHSSFFEHNPLKRYKGQALYAHIIKKTYPTFGEILTDKGYRPNDLINFFGKVSIAKSYLKKITRKVPPDMDPYGVTKAWETNSAYWQGITVSSDYFNKNEINNISKEILFKIISLSYLTETF